MLGVEDVFTPISAMGDMSMGALTPADGLSYPGDHSAMARGYPQPPCAATQPSDYSPQTDMLDHHHIYQQQHQQQQQHQHQHFPQQHQHHHQQQRQPPDQLQLQHQQQSDNSNAINHNICLNNSTELPPPPPLTPPPPKERFSYTRYQLEVLNGIYEAVRYPNSIQKQLIAKRIGITRDQVKIWFQNRRRKDVVGTKGKVPVEKDAGQVMVPSTIMSGVVTELLRYADDQKNNKKSKAKNAATAQNQRPKPYDRPANNTTRNDMSPGDGTCNLTEGRADRMSYSPPSSNQLMTPFNHSTPTYQSSEASFQSVSTSQNPSPANNHSPHHSSPANSHSSPAYQHPSPATHYPSPATQPSPVNPHQSPASRQPSPTSLHSGSEGGSSPLSVGTPTIFCPSRLTPPGPTPPPGARLIPSTEQLDMVSPPNAVAPGAPDSPLGDSDRDTDSPGSEPEGPIPLKSSGPDAPGSSRRTVRPVEVPPNVTLSTSDPLPTVSTVTSQNRHPMFTHYSRVATYHSSNLSSSSGGTGSAAIHAPIPSYRPPAPQGWLADQQRAAHLDSYLAAGHKGPGRLEYGLFSPDGPSYPPQLSQPQPGLYPGLPHHPHHPHPNMAGRHPDFSAYKHPTPSVDPAMPPLGFDRVFPFPMMSADPPLRLSTLPPAYSGDPHYNPTGYTPPSGPHPQHPLYRDPYQPLLISSLSNPYYGMDHTTWSPSEDRKPYPNL